MSNELIENSQAKVQRVFGDLESMSIATTSQVLHQNKSTWPFVTIPDFEDRAAKLRSTSKALVVAFNPLVGNEDRQVWEQYTVQNQDWLQQEYGGFTQPEAINGNIWGYADKKQRHLEQGTCSARRRLSSDEKVKEVEPEGIGPFVPVWHLSPLPPANDTSIINYNMFDRPVMKKAADLINFTRKPVILDVCTQTLWFGSTMPHEEGELQTVVVAPVFADFTDDSPVVGYYIAVFLWKDFFEHILHPKLSEMLFVLSNTCDEVFTHIVTGVNVTLVSETDAHNPKFNMMGVSSTFADFSNSKQLLEEGLGKHCVYTIDVYPTESMENDYLTRTPIWYMLAVLVTFALTSIIFILYDCFVRQQEQRIVKAGEKHEQLVSSLFPEDVRNEVLQIAEQQKQDRLSGQDGVSLLSTAKSDEEAMNASINVFGSKPIANVYQHTTVFFADIAGFTAWSSTRDATAVFTLLEGVYHAFDFLAATHSIFKVETIGDCYVAVSGLPNKDPMHAVNMAKFAKECLGKFQHVISVFKFVLGENTGMSTEISCLC
jgi:Adenylate and Guanylate cyclase catalytic domain/CHASE domain